MIQKKFFFDGFPGLKQLTLQEALQLGQDTKDRHDVIEVKDTPLDLRRTGARCARHQAHHFTHQPPDVLPAMHCRCAFPVVLPANPGLHPSLFSSCMPLSPPPEKGTFEGVTDESFLVLVRWNVLLQLAMKRIAAVCRSQLFTRDTLQCGLRPC